MRILLVSVGILAMTACVPQSIEPPEKPEPEPIFVPQGDTCGAGNLSKLVGASKATVEGMSFDQPVRIIGAGNAAVTTDFDPKRLNFLIAGDEVLEITCG